MINLFLSSIKLPHSLDYISTLVHNVNMIIYHVDSIIYFLLLEIIAFMPVIIV